MSQFGTSPISGLPLTMPNDHLGNFSYYVGDPIGPWATSLNFDISADLPQSRPLNLRAPFQLANLDLTEIQLAKLKALAASKAFQSRLRGYNIPLYVSTLELSGIQGERNLCLQAFEREIKEATVVVVDLTENNFNVAFEAGYALALGKPIVWTMRSPIPEKLPFDIQSHNILSYEVDNMNEFGEMLKFRLLAALVKTRE